MLKQHMADARKTKPRLSQPPAYVTFQQISSSRPTRACTRPRHPLTPTGGASPAAARPPRRASRHIREAHRSSGSRQSDRLSEMRRRSSASKGRLQSNDEVARKGPRIAITALFYHNSAAILYDILQYVAAASGSSGMVTWTDRSNLEE